jgi:hypothetical protein
MRKLLIAVAVLLTLVSFAGSAFAQPPVADAPLCGNVEPENARLGEFQHINVAGKQLSPSQMADMGLSFHRLTQAEVVLNYYRNSRECGGGYWKREVLPAGELVVRHFSGYTAYRVACWNRIIVLNQQEPVVEPAPAPPVMVKRPRAFWRWLRDIIEWPFYRYDQE